MKKTIILGITGGIAAVKIPDLIKKIQSENISVEVILTPAAQELLDLKTIERIIAKKVYTSLFAKKLHIEQILKKRQVEHIKLADTANTIVIAPATANVIAKLAQGIADDYLTTVVLAATCPIIICPSMNVHMWHHPSTQKNVQILRSMGYIIVEPDSGLLACGYEGQGRLASTEVIAEQTTKVLKRSDLLHGKKIIVTAGGTKESIDDVRFITNRSSGKMGVAIAEAAFLQGADVTFICSKTSVRPRYSVQILEFETGEDLEKLLHSHVKKADYLFHAAAVSDFFLKKQSGKISSNTQVVLTLNPKEKIVEKIKQWNPSIKLIAFKAESNVSEEKLIDKSKEKLAEAHADFVIANDVGKIDQGFEADTNEVFVISQEKVTKIPLASKSEIAERIINITFPNIPNNPNIPKTSL